MPKTMTPTELRSALTDGGEIALIDVRERACCGRGRLLLSVNLPLSHFELRIGQFVPRLTTRVVLHDDGEGLAERAATLMTCLGYDQVYVLGGGVSACAGAGFEIFQYHYVFTYAFGLYVAQSYRTPEITPEALKAKIDAGEDLVILDTRQPPEFEHASIPGATNVPTTELIYHIKDLAPDPKTQVFVNCGAITRGVLGGQTLREAGLENPMQVVSNGVRGWFMAGYELANSCDDRPPETSEDAKQWSRQAAERISRQVKAQPITCAELNQWRKDPDRTLFVVDVRTREEYEAGHLADAVWILGSEIVGLYEDYIATRNARVCLVDDNEARATVAATWLTRMGWPDVFVLSGGIDGHDLITGPAKSFTPSIAQVDVHAISANQLAVLIEHSAVLVLDFANSAAYEEGHIPGAWWTIRSSLQRLAAKLPPCAQIVATSPDGALARLAAKDLQTLVDVPVTALDGGTDQWRRQGRHMISGLTRVLGEIDDLLADVTVRKGDDRVTAMDCSRRMVEWQNQLLAKIERDSSFSFPKI